MATEIRLNGSTLPDDGDVMTAAQVADAFRVDRKTVSRWAKTGKLISGKTPGGHLRFSGPEVRALLKDSSR